MSKLTNNEKNKLLNTAFIKTGIESDGFAAKNNKFNLIICLGTTIYECNGCSIDSIDSTVNETNSIQGIPITGYQTNCVDSKPKLTINVDYMITHYDDVDMLNKFNEQFENNKIIVENDKPTEKIVYKEKIIYKEKHIPTFDEIFIKNYHLFKFLI